MLTRVLTPLDRVESYVARVLSIPSVGTMFLLKLSAVHSRPLPVPLRPPLVTASPPVVLPIRKVDRPIRSLTPLPVLLNRHRVTCVLDPVVPIPQTFLF